jgi:hypothetical protein
MLGVIPVYHFQVDRMLLDDMIIAMTDLCVELRIWLVPFTSVFL